MDKNDIGEESKNQNYNIINKRSSFFFVFVGYGMMLLALFYYDTSVCKSGSSCTHDIGLINNNNKSDIVTIGMGGLLYLGACVLSKNQNEKSKK